MTFSMKQRDSVIDVKILPNAGGMRIDRALVLSLPTLSRERIKSLIKNGAVVVDGITVYSPAQKANIGEQFVITVPASRPLLNIPQDIPLNIAFEDEHLVVVDKPAGLVVHPAAGNADGTLVNALLHHCAGQLSGIGGVIRPGIVHRIDKHTSGLLVAAKTDRAHEGLARQFADHSIDRRYRAIVARVPRLLSGTVDAPLARSPSDRKKIAIVAGGKRAVTHYRTVKRLRNAALMECRLETGRTHQVRVHMSSIGHPLLGDRTYAGAKNSHHDVLRKLEFRRQALHAARLGFAHPVSGNLVVLDSEMPKDMQELFSHLDV